VTDVASLNPDGTIATIVINQTATPQQFVLRTDGNQIWAMLGPKAAATFVWHAGPGASMPLRSLRRCEPAAASLRTPQRSGHFCKTEPGG
jgi:hypothetical protein